MKLKIKSNASKMLMLLIIFEDLQFKAMNKLRHQVVCMSQFRQSSNLIKITARFGAYIRISLVQIEIISKNLTSIHCQMLQVL